MRTSQKTYLPGLKTIMEGRKTGYVADKIGIDQSTLSQYVACKRGASLAMALRLAAYFNTSVEQLVQDHEMASV